jgi:hypothetical protein
MINSRINFEQHQL